MQGNVERRELELTEEMFNSETDMTCLAEGLVVPADYNKTGLNLNELIIGTTGCGKTYSNAYSRALHTMNSSLVIPYAKKEFKEKFSEIFAKRGYKVISLDFTKAEESTIGYDPMDYVNCTRDSIRLSKSVSSINNEKTAVRDEFWEKSATSLLSSLIELVRLKGEKECRKVHFSEVIELLNSIELDSENDLITTNIDILFKRMEKDIPNNQATNLWKTFKNNPPKTAACVFTTLNTAVDKLFTEDIIKLMNKSDRLSISELGQYRVVLFVKISPMDLTLQSFINVLYSDIFHVLFDVAQKNATGRLYNSVHLICDDFACTGKINDFEKYISIFRAVGISVSLLLQSESQLQSIYGEKEATTIINNCDTLVYMGGTDVTTCNSVARRMNKPLHYIMEMPLEQVIVFRRGSKPYISKRYQIFNDPLYIKEMNEMKEMNEIEEKNSDIIVFDYDELSEEVEFDPFSDDK